MGGRLNVKQIVGVVYIDHPSLSNLYTNMNARIERIAHDLEYSTYKDETHGRIARDNFVYGVAQAKIEIIDIINKRWDYYADQNCKANNESAPTDRIAYLAGQRDAMIELLKMMREE